MRIQCVPLGENYMGMSYGEWAGVWWNWLLSEKPEYDGGPMLFTRGANKSDSVDEDSVPTLEHTKAKKGGVNIPYGTAIFTGVCDAMFRLKSNCSNKSLDTVAQARELAKTHTNAVSEVGAIIVNSETREKSKIVENLAAYRVQSPLFRLYVSEACPFLHAHEYEIKAGLYDAITEGYYILIRPLEPGQYQFRYYAKATEGDYKYNSVYDITVEKPKEIDSKINIDKSEAMLS